jgi:hypothetical protein
MALTGVGASPVPSPLPAVLWRFVTRSLTLLVIAFLAAGCAKTPTTPEPSGITISAVSPPSGTVVVPPQYPDNAIGGVVIPPDSGVISVSLSIRSAHEVPWAQLNVYLLTASDYCGQNLPDSPTWEFLPEGWTTTYTVTGFQIYQLPCDVAGVRAMFHARNSGALTPPTPAETIADATFPVSLQIRR